MIDSTTNGEVHFRQIVTLLVRRWRLIMSITLIGGLLVVMGALLLPPRYTAKAQLLQNIEYHDGKADVDDVAVDTLVELLMSPSQLRTLAAGLAEMETGGGQLLPGFAELEDRLLVYKERRSRLISVTFLSEDPETAATVVNLAVDSYLRGVADRLQAEHEAALKSVAARIETARQDADRAVADLRAFRLANGMFADERADQVDTQIGLLNQQLAIARAELAAMDAQLESGAAEHPSDSANSLRISTVADNALPQVNEAESSDGALISRADLERLRLERGDAASRLRDIEVRLAALRGAAAASGEQQVQLRDFERKSVAADEVFQSLTRRQADLMASGAGSLPARLISRASLPERPSSPNPLLFLFPALVGSALLSSILALSLELSDTRLRSEWDVDKALHVPCIGLVPKRDKRRGNDPLDLLPSDHFGPFVEGVRAITVAARKRSGSGEPPRSFLFTSSSEGDGATTLAISFALYASRLNQRVLLVDMNFRRPGIVTTLGEPKSDDLNIRRIEALDIDYLPPPQSGSDPVAIIGANDFSSFMSQITKDYDCVVIDSAPVTIATETRLLTSLVDSVILVVKWGVTNAETARSAVHALRAHGANAPISVAINQADMHVHVRHRYGKPTEAHAPLQGKRPEEAENMPLWSNPVRFTSSGAAARTGN